jgi:hypothetical protein
LFAASVALPELHIDCAVPALDTVGAAVTVMVTLETEEAQGALEIVHLNT